MAAKKPSRYCKFNGCKNHSCTENIHLFSFPKEEDRCKAWIKAANNPKFDGLSAAYIHKHSVLCGDHFHEWCFMNTKSRKSLVHNAVPASPKPPPKKVSSTINLTTLESEVSCRVIKSELEELLTAPEPVKAPSLNLSTPHKLVSSPVLQNQIPINSTMKTPGSVVSYVTKSEVKELPTSLEPAEALNLSKPRKLIHSPVFQNQIPINSTTKTCGLAVSCVTSSELKGLLITPTPTKAPLLNLSKLPTNSASQEANCSSPIHRRNPKNYTPREKELAKKIRQLREKLRYVNTKFQLYKKKHPPKQPLKEILASQGVSEELSNFIEHQVNLDKCKKVKRYTEYDKAQAYGIFCESAAAYNALKNVLVLPSKRTLQRFMSTKPSTKDNNISVKEISKNEN